MLPIGTCPATTVFAAAAGVSKGSFYTYFASKLDLVEGLVLPVASACVGALDECEAALTLARTADELRTAYLRLANALTRVVTEHAGVALLYLQEARAPAVGAREPLCKLSVDLRRRAVVLTHAARSHGLVRSLDPHVTALAVVSAAEGLLFEALSGGELGAPADVTATLVELALGGVATR